MLPLFGKGARAPPPTGLEKAAEIEAILNWILEGGLNRKVSVNCYFRFPLNCDFFFHSLDDGVEVEEIHKKIFRKWINFKLAMVSLARFEISGRVNATKDNIR